MTRDEHGRSRCRLYAITPPRIDLDRFADALKAALDGGDVACLQLRLKDQPDADILRAAERLQPICRPHNAAFIVNDRPDLALKCDADGTHVGQEDMSYDQARRLLGQSKIVGVTCHASRHLAMEAAEKGADYVAFGAFFATATKQAKGSAAPEILEWWSELFEIPCVAIGGITVENCPPLVRAGADFLSVISGIWDYPAGPQAAVRDFNATIVAARVGG
jgi:thiamine-phosphate pyrophosphorylase